MEDPVLKIRSGIPGLDSVISGGFRSGRSTVLSGPPGSGKTTFGMQFLSSGARDFDESGIFITLSQSPSEIKNDFKSFGWDVQKLVEEGRLIIIDARPFKEEEGFIVLDESLYRGESFPFMHLTQLIMSSIKRINAKRLVIDSITVLTMQYVNNFYIRQGLQGLIQSLEDHNVSSLLISETDDSGKIPLEWYVASGIISLSHVRKGDTMERTVQIIKMRGMKHSEQIFQIKINKTGIQVMHPRLTP